MIIKQILTATAIALLPFTAHAWEGVDIQTGHILESVQKTPLKEGEIVEAANFNTGEYKFYEVLEVFGPDNLREVILYDLNEGESKHILLDPQ